MTTVDPAWSFATLLALATIWLFALWREGIRSRVRLTKLLALILTDEAELERQRGALNAYVSGGQFPDRHILLGRLAAGFLDIAKAKDPSVLDGAIYRLWMKSPRPNSN